MDTQADSSTLSSTLSSTVAGQLPRPISQFIGDSYISWQWLPLGEHRISISAQFDRQNHSWRISMLNVEEFVYADEAKLVAEALLASYNWKDIWKIHFADMFLEMDAIENKADLKAFEMPIGPCGVTGCDV